MASCAVGRKEGRSDLLIVTDLMQAVTIQRRPGDDPVPVEKLFKHTSQNTFASLVSSGHIFFHYPCQLVHLFNGLHDVISSAGGDETSQNHGSPVLNPRKSKKHQTDIEDRTSVEGGQEAGKTRYFSEI